MNSWEANCRSKNINTHTYYSQNLYQSHDNDKSQTVITIHNFCLLVANWKFTIYTHATHKQACTITRIQRIPEMYSTKQGNKDMNFPGIQHNTDISRCAFVMDQDEIGEKTRSRISWESVGAFHLHWQPFCLGMCLCPLFSPLESLERPQGPRLLHGIRLSLPVVPVPAGRFGSWIDRVSGPPTLASLELNR